MVYKKNYSAEPPDSLKSCSKLHFSCIGIIYVYSLRLVLHIWLGLRHQDRKLIKSLFAWNNLNIIYQFTCE